MSEAVWSEIDLGSTNGLFAIAVTRRPGRDALSAGAELVRWRVPQAIFPCVRVHQNSVPSVQMHCRMTAILRATATRAFLPPMRLASLVAQAFKGEKR